MLSTYSIFSSYVLYRSVKRNLELLELVEETNEKIEEAVETLDFYYKRLDKKSKIDLFLDDPTVRELVDDVKQARKTVSLISESLTGDKNDTENLNQLES